MRNPECVIRLTDALIDVSLAMECVSRWAVPFVHMDPVVYDHDDEDEYDGGYVASRGLLRKRLTDAIERALAAIPGTATHIDPLKPPPLGATTSAINRVLCELRSHLLSYDLKFSIMRPAEFGRIQAAVCEFITDISTLDYSAIPSKPSNPPIQAGLIVPWDEENPEYALATDLWKILEVRQAFKLKHERSFSRAIKQHPIRRMEKKRPPRLRLHIGEILQLCRGRSSTITEIASDPTPAQISSAKISLRERHIKEMSRECASAEEP